MSFTGDPSDSVLDLRPPLSLPFLPPLPSRRSSALSLPLSSCAGLLPPLPGRVGDGAAAVLDHADWPCGGGDACVEVSVAVVAVGDAGQGHGGEGLVDSADVLEHLEEEG